MSHRLPACLRFHSLAVQAVDPLLTRASPGQPDQLTKEAIDRILAEVGEVPSDIKRDKLRHDLSLSLRLWHNLSAHLAPFERRKWLRRELDEARQQRDRLAGYFPDNPLDLLISRLEREIERELDPSSAKLVEFKFKSGGMQFAPTQARRNPSKWLAGTRLPEIYEAHFKRRAAASRRDGAPSGPYIRFALACFAEFDISYGGEAARKYQKARYAAGMKGTACKNSA